MNVLRSKTPDRLISIRAVTPKFLFKLDEICEKSFEYIRNNATPKPKSIENMKTKPSANEKSRNFTQTSEFSSEIQYQKQSNEREPISFPTIKYSQFQEHHKKFQKRNSKGCFLNKNLVKNAAKIKKIELEIKEHKESKNNHPEDTFLKNTIYSKPAMTYGEKVFRLNQVSIFPS